jgi:hypothetical protein
MLNNIEIVKYPILKKRGRKSKKELQLLIANNTIIDKNDNDDKDDKDDKDDNNDNELNNPPIFFIPENNIIDTENDNIIPKKRGRKPKGGKIIQQIESISSNVESKTNVILHLKCLIKDLQLPSSLEHDIQSFNFINNTQQHQLTYDLINTENINFNTKNNTKQNIQNNCSNEVNYNENTDISENDVKEVWKKLKILEHNLHINNICDNKSACFWCTCEFDNPPVYIPKFFLKSTYQVYGCFCSPECATAYLMEEKIDNSSKFERYYLINHIYSKIYNYQKNIKPAPNPYYMLDKYYGNLSIQEYRSLLRNERLFLIVDKPLTRILPELLEENDDFIVNNKLIPSNTYQLKKKIKKQTKNIILNENFGLLQ